MEENKKPGLVLAPGEKPSASLILNEPFDSGQSDIETLPLAPDQSLPATKEKDYVAVSAEDLTQLYAHVRTYAVEHNIAPVKVAVMMSSLSQEILTQCGVRVEATELSEVPSGEQ